MRKNDHEQYQRAGEQHDEMLSMLRDLIHQSQNNNLDLVEAREAIARLQTTVYMIYQERDGNHVWREKGHLYDRHRRESLGNSVHEEEISRSDYLANIGTIDRQVPQQQQQLTWLHESAPCALLDTADELLWMICSQSEVPTHLQDLNTILQSYYDFSNKQLAQATYLAEKDRMRRWLSSTDSDLILADGHSGSDRITAMSVFCASLARTLEDVVQRSLSGASGTTVTLWFFCGLHPGNGDSLPGPCGLMRSLVAQLLMSWPANTPMDLCFAKDIPGLATNTPVIDTRTACYVFQRLVCQLPHSALVHCVIDGVSHFETSLWGCSEDMEMVVELFQWCVDPRNVAACVKFLLASCDRSVLLGNIVPRNRKVDLSAGDYARGAAIQGQLIGGIET